ncbi:murein biosynthesis integral membrane protein MurJ [Candidatus Kuenenbacteria bacterium CG11_big_fil_rev_8_21_14_0_20_37_9]|uniref:Probable lipid II flippase MurJ n=1 Tax=Candidatus Kuenenbacteria bacterium CG08_land_8_20_14_0_20_37_23 TaxID=1974617 RepID=A0A2M6XS75_9BACT|nr:MAG: murein biosynthesis integral membrane protein MurJ [Candidatus Kuenenbacteria bacterium CG11_big_fil_rev_8_21_14_0_20_37_9]PIU10486.1 MAG: murein biosynthesis integral membrane protein MurJ [Candidatus Kuenenbacteria bacterium CG08_land_8_20_14_0_20_37_23]
MSKVFNIIKNKLNKSVTGGAIIIAAFSVLSKIFGLVRDRLLATSFGAGDVLDAYYVAFRLPDLIFNTLIFGALSAAFIPVFIAIKQKNMPGVKTREHTNTRTRQYGNIKNMENGGIAIESKDDVINHWQLSSSVMNIIFAALVFFTVIFFIFASQLVRLIAPGFAGEKLLLTISMTRIMLLSILFFGISNVISGILQATKNFSMFALAPVMYNVGIIFGIVFLVGKIGAIGLAYGVVLGAFLHLAVQIPTVVRAGFRWRPILRLKNKAVRKIGRLMLPRTLGLAVGQINQLVITIIASTLAAGSIAVFNLAANLASVPISIFAISFAVASFPVFSESFVEKDEEKFVVQFSVTVRRILFFIIPISVFIIALRAQTVRLILGAGAFDWQDTVLTADALGYFCISLFAQSLVPLLARAFYARNDTLTPVIVSVISLLANIAGSILLVRVLGVRGLALSFSISSIINMVVLAVILKHKFGWLDEKKIALSILKIMTAAIGGVIFLQITKYLIAPLVDMGTFVGVMTQFLAAGIMGVLVYFIVSFLIDSEEIKKLWRYLRSVISN